MGMIFVGFRFVIWVGLPVENSLGGMVSCEGDGWDDIVDETDPNDLYDIEWRLYFSEGGEEDEIHGDDEEGEVEEDEPLDVFLDVFGPLEHANETGKLIVLEDYLAGLFDGAAAGLHRDAHVATLHRQDVRTRMSHIPHHLVLTLKQSNHRHLLDRARLVHHPHSLKKLKSESHSFVVLIQSAHLLPRKHLLLHSKHLHTLWFPDYLACSSVIQTALQTLLCK